MRDVKIKIRIWKAGKRTNVLVDVLKIFAIGVKMQFI